MDAATSNILAMKPEKLASLLNSLLSIAETTGASVWVTYEINFQEFTRKFVGFDWFGPGGSNIYRSSGHIDIHAFVLDESGVRQSEVLSEESTTFELRKS
jgi:hypothetical protein